MKALILITPFILCASIQVHGKGFIEDPLTESEINALRGNTSSIDDEKSPENRQLIPNVIYNLFNNGVFSAQSPNELGLLGSQAEVDALTAQRDSLINQLRAAQQQNALNAVGAAKVQTAKDFCNGKITGLVLTTLTTGRYYFHNDDTNLKNWFEAKEFCRQKGMELVSIETQEENTAIKTKINEILTGILRTNDLFYWTGLNNLANKAIYMWTGIGTRATYFDWSTDLTTPSGYCDENCGEIFRRFFLDQWNDRVCSGIWKGRFICELTKPCSTLI